jgi:hypothetical protein
MNDINVTHKKRPGNPPILNVSFSFLALEFVLGVSFVLPVLGFAGLCKN